WGVLRSFTAHHPGAEVCLGNLAKGIRCCFCLWGLFAPALLPRWKGGREPRRSSPTNPDRLVGPPLPLRSACRGTSKQNVVQLGHRGSRPAISSRIALKPPTSSVPASILPRWEPPARSPCRSPARLRTRHCFPG